MEKRTPEIAEEAFQLAYVKKDKEAAEVIVNYIGFKMDADKKRAIKHIKEVIAHERRFKVYMSREAFEFCIRGIMDAKDRLKGKFK